MDIRRLTDSFFAAPQIEPTDMPDVAAMGITTIICNRPDSENPIELQCEAMKIAAEAAGMAFHVIPVGHDGLSQDMFDNTAQILEDSAGPVLAYCRSGTRSTNVWAFTMAGEMPVDEIVEAAAGAGYNLAGARAQLEQIAGSR